MRYENVAPLEVVKSHLNDIQKMFDSSGEGVDLWRNLNEQERVVLCQFAGVDDRLACHSIKNFNPSELRRLRKGAKRLEKLAARFNQISFLDFR